MYKPLTAWRRSKARLWISRNIECYCYPKVFRERLGNLEAGMLKRIGIKPIEIKMIPIDALYMQYRSEWYQDNLYSAPVKVIHAFLVDFLKGYQQHGLEILESDRFQETTFYKWHRHLDSVGFHYDWYDYPNTFEKSNPYEKIVQKARKLINVYESIRATGYLGNNYSNNMISVLDCPFENSRFNRELHINGYEIWSGHHRASSLAALGEKVVEVVILHDTLS